jgi:hypothetical protein
MLRDGCVATEHDDAVTRVDESIGVALNLSKAATILPSTPSPNGCAPT